MTLPPTTQKTQYRCGKCRTLFEREMLVDVSVNLFVAQLREVRCPSCGGKKILMGQGRTLAEDRNFEWGDSYEERVAGWRMNGELGLSAQAIWDHMQGKPTKGNHPHDLGDLRRCLLLLERVPEWKPRIREMATLSPQWASLSALWEAIVESFHAEGGEDLAGPDLTRTEALFREAIGDAGL